VLGVSETGVQLLMHYEAPADMPGKSVATSSSPGFEGLLSSAEKGVQLHCDSAQTSEMR